MRIAIFFLTSKGIHNEAQISDWLSMRQFAVERSRVSWCGVFKYLKQAFLGQPGGTGFTKPTSITSNGLILLCKLDSWSYVRSLA